LEGGEYFALGTWAKGAAWMCLLVLIGFEPLKSLKGRGGMEDEMTVTTTFVLVVQIRTRQRGLERTKRVTTMKKKKKKRKKKVEEMMGEATGGPNQILCWILRA